MTHQQQQIIVFTVLALLSYSIWQKYFNPEETTVDKPFTKGYSIENIKMRITDEEGQLTAKFISPSLIRYTDKPVIFIEKPIFWTYNIGKKHWLMESNIAEFNAEMNEVLLIDDVVATTVNQNLNTHFTAKNLLVNLKSKKAQTNDGILLKQQQLSMTGQIAKIDLRTEILEVSNNVKAVYQSTYNKISDNKNEK